MSAELNDFLLDGVAAVDIGGSANFAGSDEETMALAAGRPIVDALLERVTQAIVNYRDYVTVELLLAGARLAFDFGMGRIPFPIPDTAKEKLWQLVEAGIRSIWDTSNPAAA